MRRILILPLLLLLAGCGGGEDEASAPAGAGSGATIEHKFGTTEAPAAPERVVTVGYTEADVVLALGVRPVAVREFVGSYDWRTRPWAQEALGGTEPDVIGAEEINFEQVAAARPDLILGLTSGMTRNDYDRLSRIAPTVAQSGEFIDFGMPWQEQTRVIGEALGRTDRAADVVEEVEGAFARARDEFPQLAGKSFTLAYADIGADFGAYASQDTRTRFFADLGLEPATEIDELAGDSFFVNLSEERLELLDQELVVNYAERDKALRSGVFRGLDAVREERVVYLDLTDQFAGALGYSSPLSLPFLLDEAVPALAAAADGDPATTAPEPQ